MAGQPLQVVDNERDIGAIINDNLIPSLQCVHASRRASAVLTQISRALRTKIFFFNCTRSLLDVTWNLQYQHGHPG